MCVLPYLSLKEVTENDVVVASIKKTAVAIDGISAHLHGRISNCFLGRGWGARNREKKFLDGGLTLFRPYNFQNSVGEGYSASWEPSLP